MAMKLYLGFGGLCLCVPELGADGRPRKMHVLMPKAPEHQVYLMYDEGALTGTAPNGTVCLHAIDKWAIDLSRLGTNPPLQPAPAEVADLGAVRRSVPPALLTDDFSTEKTVGRVSFTAGTASVPPCAQGARWKFARKSARLPIRVIWEIEVGGTTFSVDVPDAAPASGVKTVTLKPYGDAIHLWILHSPRKPDEFPPRTKPGPERPDDTKEAEHFHAYFDLLGKGPQLPKYAGFDLDPTTLECYNWDRGLDVMCIAAKAPLATP
jgi:hypothetical protein